MKKPLDAIIDQWVLKAEHDFSAAVRLVSEDSEDEPPWDIICFHAQQCVEKYLKAVIISRQISLPRTHDLTELFPLVPVSIQEDVTQADLAELNPYAVEARYPGFYEPICKTDALRAVEIAARIKTICSDFLKKAGNNMPSRIR